MKFTRSIDLRIAKNVIDSVFTKNSPLDYQKWKDFVESNSQKFTWKENTKDGKQTLENINNVPEAFKERVLQSLKKIVCYSDYDTTKGYYNINVGFNNEDHWIRIGFERDPQIEDLKIFLEMANYLDALLLKDGTEIIDESILKSFD